LSSKLNTSPGQRHEELFQYPPAEPSPSAGAEGSAKFKPIWAARAAANPTVDANLAEQKEQQAWHTGNQAGKAEGQAAFEQQLTKQREEVANALRDFSTARETYFRRVEQELVRLTLAIARKILHREAQVDPLLLTGILRVALDKIGADTNTRLRAHPSDIDVWREYFEHAQEQFPIPEMIGDPEIQAGRCILETELGTTEIGLETQLKEIEQGFIDLLAQRPVAK
jgi:flagellar assembly protein FliH